MSSEITIYGHLLAEIKTRVRQAQCRAALSSNAEMILMYWDIGGMIAARQKQEGWGAGVIPRLAADLRNDLAEQKGFSERNIKRMLRFFQEYSGLQAKVPQPVAQLGKLRMPAMVQEVITQIPWGHNVILFEKVKDLPVRLWYARQTLEQGWSREALTAQIEKRSHVRQGGAITNFAATLPAVHANLAGGLLKDPYFFDFFTLEETFHERELESGLIAHIQRFLLELGRGFAFVGRQYPLEVGGREFYLDLLFYHLRLRCFVVVDLKKGEFKPEHAGKMNFYCSAVDDQLRHAEDQPTLGLILCQTKNRVLAEYSLRDINKPIGIADYELARALPTELASSLPSIETIEDELSRGLDKD